MYNSSLSQPLSDFPAADWGDGFGPSSQGLSFQTETN